MTFCRLGKLSRQQFMRAPDTSAEPVAGKREGGIVSASQGETAAQAARGWGTPAAEEAMNISVTELLPVVMVVAVATGACILLRTRWKN